MTLTTIIIDDEALARERTRSFLQAHADITILAEADNGITGLDAIRTHRPDLIFLDIQMPEMDGFAMLAELSPEERPAIIFTTAYDAYAIKAFEVHALDYLLKPFDKERFDAAVKRAKKQTASSTELTEKLDSLLGNLPRPTATRIAIRDQGRLYFVPHNKILWIESSGNYAEIHDGERAHLLRETMTQLEHKLPARDFIRVSRSAIVRIAAIAEIRTNAKGEHHLILLSGSKIKATIPLKELQAKVEAG